MRPLLHDLGQIEDHIWAHSLHAIVCHQNPTLRRLVVRVIGYYTHGDQVKKEVARLAKRDADDAVRTTAREALSKLARKRRYFGAPS
jgi:hypothetical protein